MTHRIGNVTFICPEPASPCDLCGRDKELRPYGPGGARICFDCANKSTEMRAIVQENMRRALGIDDEGGGDGE